MGGLERYYDKDCLFECIRFNAQFLELNNKLGSMEHWQLCQYAELQHLLAEWELRKYEHTDIISWAMDVLNTYYLIISQ